MPTDGQARTPPASARLNRDDRRALVTCLLLGVMTVSAFALVYRSAPTTTQRTAKTTIGDDLATGSIIFEPTLGNTCRHLLIDNATWRIRDAGTVDCRAALSQNWSSRRLTWSSARVDVIRDGFTRR